MTFKLLLSTAVWGEDYLEIFLEYTLKSLLKSKNLLNNQVSNKSKYIIYSESKHLNSIKKHRNFKKLNKKIEIIFCDLKNNNLGNKYLSLKTYQNLAIQYGYKNKFDYFIFIYPDSIFGENHFSTLLSKVKRGFKVIMCPGPLGIYENFFTIFRKKEINNKNLSAFIIKNLHPFYQSFLNNNVNSRLSITVNKERSYQIYKCLDLHPAIISLSIKDLQIKNTFDEDILNNKNISLSDIDYLNHSNQGIIITLETFNSNRGKISKNYNLKELKNINSDVYDVIKYCDKKNFLYNINHHLKGNYIVSEKRPKNYLDLIFFQSEKIKHLKTILRYNNVKINNKNEIVEQFLEFKKNNFEIKNEFTKILQNEMSARVKLDLEIETNRQIKIAESILQNQIQIEKKRDMENSYRERENSYRARQRERENSYRVRQRERENSYIRVISDENIIKLSIISIFIVIFRSLPAFLRAPFTLFKQKNRSNKFINKNLRLIKFLIILPRKTVIKILLKRII
jgi:hypothetical protein